jgi:hypothetical protein
MKGADHAHHSSARRRRLLGWRQQLDVDAIVATFAPDAYVKDARREIKGIDVNRRWVERRWSAIT